MTDHLTLTVENATAFSLAHMLGVPEHEGRPVFEVVPTREDVDGRLLVVFQCPVCGTVHTHGLPNLNPTPSHRAAHCRGTSPLRDGGYFVRLLISDGHTRGISNHRHPEAMTLLRASLADLEDGVVGSPVRRRVCDAAAFLRSTVKRIPKPAVNTCLTSPGDALHLIREALRIVEFGKKAGLKEALWRLDTVAALLRLAYVPVPAVA